MKDRITHYPNGYEKSVIVYYIGGKKKEHYKFFPNGRLKSLKLYDIEGNVIYSEENEEGE